jgi:hypothetical protein
MSMVGGKVRQDVTGVAVSVSLLLQSQVPMFAVYLAADPSLTERVAIPPARTKVQFTFIRQGRIPKGVMAQVQPLTYVRV